MSSFRPFTSEGASRKRMSAGQERVTERPAGEPDSAAGCASPQPGDGTRGRAQRLMDAFSVVAPFGICNMSLAMASAGFRGSNQRMASSAETISAFGRIV